jgi:hypothetical protein
MRATASSRERNGIVSSAARVLGFAGVIPRTPSEEVLELLARHMLGTEVLD